MPTEPVQGTPEEVAIAGRQVVVARIKEFVQDMEKAGVNLTGWDDEAVYFSGDQPLDVRVEWDFRSKTHTVVDMTERTESDG